MPRMSLVGAALVSGAAIVAAACSASDNLGQTEHARDCSNLVARALSSAEQTVPGVFACMSKDEQNFWHRYAVSKDEQLPDIVRARGITRGGLVEGFDPRAQWTSSTYLGDASPQRRVYVVRAADGTSSHALLVIATDGSGHVDGFVFRMYD